MKNLSAVRALLSLAYALKGKPPRAPSRGGSVEIRWRCASRSLRCWIRVGATEYVAVAKVRRASLLWSWLIRYGSAIRDGYLGRGAPGVNRRAVGCIAGVIPDCGAVAIGRDSIDIITEELQPQIVLGRAAWISWITAVS